MNFTDKEIEILINAFSLSISHFEEDIKKNDKVYLELLEKLIPRADLHAQIKEKIKKMHGLL